MNAISFSFVQAKSTGRKDSHMTGHGVHRAKTTLGQKSVEKLGIKGQWMQEILSEIKLNRESQPKFVIPGRAQKIVESMSFHVLVAVIIGLNSIIIGLETDYKMAEMDGGWYIFHMVQSHFFALAFCLELILKISAYGWIEYLFGQDRHWNRLDFGLVALSTFETFIVPYTDPSLQGNMRQMSVFRMIRLLRLLRMLRLLKSFRQLWFLSSGIVNALPVTFWGCVLTAFVVYMFAIFATSQLEEYCEEDPLMHDYFGTLLRSMFTLTQVMTGDSWASAVVRPVLQHSPYLVIFFYIFVFLTQFAVLNVVTAVIVENVLKEAIESQEEHMKRTEQELRRVLYSIYDSYQTMDTNNDGVLNREEFMAGVQDPHVRALLSTVGVSIEKAEEMFEIIDFDHSGTISLEEFANGCMMAAKDLLSVQCQLYKQSGQQKRIISYVDNHGPIAKRLRFIETALCELGGERVRRLCNAYESSTSVTSATNSIGTSSNYSSQTSIAQMQSSGRAPSDNGSPDRAPRHIPCTQVNPMWERVLQQIDVTRANLEKHSHYSNSWELAEALGGVELRLQQLNMYFFPPSNDCSPHKISVATAAESEPTRPSRVRISTSSIEAIDEEGGIEKSNTVRSLHTNKSGVSNAGEDNNKSPEIVSCLKGSGEPVQNAAEPVQTSTEPTLPQDAQAPDMSTPQQPGSNPMAPGPEYWQWLHYQQWYQAQQAAMYMQNFSPRHPDANQSPGPVPNPRPGPGLGPGYGSSPGPNSSSGSGFSQRL